MEALAVHPFRLGDVGPGENGGSKIDQGNRSVYQQLLVVSRERKNQRYADVGLVRLSLVERHRELAQVVAIIRREYEISVVEQIHLHQPLDDLFNQFVDSQESLPPLSIVSVDGVDDLLWQR